MTKGTSMKLKPYFSCVLSITFLTLLSTCQGQLTPRFLETPSGTYYVTRSKPASIVCEAENVDSIEFTCAKDTSNVLVLGRVLESGVETVKATLEVSKSDIRGYTASKPFTCECIGKTQSGTIIRSRESQVKSAFLKRQFVTSPSDKEAPIGSKVELNCVPPQGEPYPTISWLKNGKKVHIEREKNLIQNSRGMLIIKKLRKKDVGRYSCVAKNMAAKRISNAGTIKVGDASIEDRLEASDAPVEDGPVFVQAPETLSYVSSGKTVELTCRVVGASLLTVRCNRRRLTDAEQKTKEVESEQGLILESKFPVSEDDVRRYGIDGTYSCYCVAWFSKPGASGWSSKDSPKGYVELAYIDKQFEAEPTSQTVGVDSSLTLMCKAPRSKPPATITWYFNNAPLDVNSGYVIVDKDGSLTIESVSLSNSGDYKCRASNVAGTRESQNARIIVKDGVVEEDKPETRRPTRPTRPARPTRPVPEPQPTTPTRRTGEAYFSVPFKSVYYLSQDTPATLTCAVKNSDMITIRCNSRRYERNEIKSEQTYNREVGKFDITSSITVTYEELQQANGEFNCICTMWFTVSGNWERNETGPAQVEEAFIEEEFAMEPVDSQVQLGLATELVCSPPFGGPEPEVYWMKNGQRLDVSSDDNVEVTVDGSLSIVAMRDEDAGQYICVASNDAGVLYSRAAALTVLESETATDSITESILVDGASTAEPEEYTPYGEPEATSEPETGVVHTGSPMFTTEPETSYYVIKNKPTTIVCAAKNVERIVYRCSGFTVPDYRVVQNDNDNNGAVSVSLELNREDVEAFTDDNSCVCDGVYRDQGTNQEMVITSRPGYLNLAYIKRRFRKNPEDITAIEGMMAALPCAPPEAVPRPSVYWLHNGERVVISGTSIVQPDDNSLVFLNPTQDQAGDYTCIAENIAGNRTSNTARLIVEAPTGGVVPGEVDESYPETTFEPESEEYEPKGETAEPESEEGQTEGEGHTETEVEEGQGQPDVEEGQGESEESESEEGQVVAGSDQTEPEPEGEVYVTSEPYVTDEDDIEVIGYPETTSEYVTEEWGNEAAVQPTVSSESDSTEQSEEDTSVTRSTQATIVIPQKTTETMIKSVNLTESVVLENVTIPVISKNLTEPVIIRSNETMVVSIFNESMETGEIETKPIDNEIESHMITTEMPVKTKKKPKGQKKPKPTSKKFRRCQEKMILCQRYFTEQIQPAEDIQDMDAICRATAEFSMCVDEFVDKCQGEIKENAIDTILYTRDRLTSSCNDNEGNVVVDTNLGPYESCNELQMCTRHLTEGDAPMFSDANSACNDLTSMLMCGDSALSKCNIENRLEGGEVETTLATVGEWYSKYCNKIIMERQSFMTCDSLKSCNSPLNASTSVRDMYNVNSWCPYTHKVIMCTRNAVENCQPGEREQIESDLRMLNAEALQICPIPGREPETVDASESTDNDENSATVFNSNTSIFLSFIHVVFLLVLSLR